MIDLEKLPKELQDLVPIAKALVEACFPVSGSISTSIGESLDGMPRIILETEVSSSPEQASKQYIEFQEKWQEACPEIYRPIIKLAYRATGD